MYLALLAGRNRAGGSSFWWIVESIYVMIGGLASIAVQNSCQKDVFDPSFDSRRNRTFGFSSSRNVRHLFFEDHHYDNMGQ